MRQDAYGLIATTRSDRALAAYDSGVELMLSGNAGAENRFTAAIAEDDGFALAHVALGRHCQLFGRFDEARAAGARAEALATGLGERERGHVAAVGFALKGRPAEAMDALKAQMAAFPRDAVVLSLALGVYGLIAFSGRREHHAEQRQLLESLAAHWGEDWWFRSYLGWSLTETGAPAAGADMIDRSLQAYPRNANAEHARMHAYIELGQNEAGAKMLAAWLPPYPREAVLHCHLHWHMALFELDAGNAAAAFELYMVAIRPSQAVSAPLAVLADVSSLLWRCEVYGVGPRPLPWPEADDLARRAFPKAGLAFADLHCAMAAAALGDRAALDHRIAELDALAASGRLRQGEVVPTLCRALGAYAQGADDEAIRLLDQAMADLPRVAGSHTQREVFEDTLIAACLRSGQGERARALLSRRLERRPRRLDAAWLARA
jgi:tetratricopeptide (TPR) repeat protein